MGGHAYTVADGLAKHHGFAAELLGGSDAYGEWARITDKPGARPETKMLAVVLAGSEKSFSRESWRKPAPAAKQYLSQFEAWGYTLSDVERIIAAHGTKPETEVQTGEVEAE